MRAPVVPRTDITPDSVADNYASMCPGYMEDFYAKLISKIGKVVDISTAKGRDEQVTEVAEDGREKVRASGLG